MLVLTSYDEVMYTDKYVIWREIIIRISLKEARY